MSNKTAIKKMRKRTGNHAQVSRRVHVNGYTITTHSVKAHSRAFPRRKHVVVR